MSDIKTICYLPGNWNPPTKYDLRIAEWLARKINDVSEVKIIIGKSQPGELTPDQKEDIWRAYLPEVKFAPITIQKNTEYSPLTCIYKIFERHPDETFSIALPEDLAKDQNLQERFEGFSNYSILITPEYDRAEGPKMLEAVNSGDFRAFCKYIPPEMLPDKKKDLFELLKPKQEEGVLNKNYWDNMVSELFTQYGIK